MPTETLPILGAVVAVSLVSLIGAMVLVRGNAIRSKLHLLVALAAGALIGDTFLHLLPHAVADEGGFTSTISWGVLGGLIGFFLIEGLLHWHHHGEDVHDHGPSGIHSVGYMNLIGDALHNFIDGMLIAATWLVSPEAGIATTIAVVLHEIPQEFGDLGVLLHAGFTPKRALFLNLLCGLVAVAGAFFVLVMHNDFGLQHLLVPIAAGGFLYIACADLVPEMHKSAKGKRMVGTVLALGLGIALMAGVSLYEEHAHGHSHGGHSHGGHSHGGHSHGDDHSGHDHSGDDHSGHDHSGHDHGD